MNQADVPAIALTGFTKTYRAGVQVGPVDLHVAAGESVGLVGPIWRAKRRT